MTTNRLTENYIERQGRPASKIALDQDTRTPSISTSSIRNIVLQILEEELNEGLAEIIVELAELLKQTRLVKLHLAKMSNADLDEEDGEEQ